MTTPISPFLALNTRSGGTPVLQRYVNCTPTPTGTAFGALDNNTGVTGLLLATNLDSYPAIVKFGGSSSFLALTGNQVYRSVDGGANTWTSVYTLANLAATAQGVKSGLFVINVNSVATAVLLYQDYGTVNWYAATSTDGTSWTTYGPLAGPTTKCCPTDSEIYQGKLLTVFLDANDYTKYRSILFDPATGTASFAVAQATGAQGWDANASTCVMQDRMFMVVQGPYSSGVGAQLWELIGGVWTLDATLIQTTGTGQPNNDNYKTALWTDNTNLYAACLFGFPTSGWTVYQITSALAVTTITSAVLPSSLSSPGPNTQKCKILTDNRQLPGTGPFIYLMFANDTNTSDDWNQWQWNGPATQISFIQAGGDSTHSMPFVAHTQGSTFWTAGEVSLELRGRAATSGGIVYSFILYSDTGLTSGLNIRGWHGLNTDDWPDNIATLFGTTTGLLADNATVRTVVWQATTDGYSVGQQPKFVLEQF